MFGEGYLAGTNQTRVTRFEHCSRIAKDRKDEDSGLNLKLLYGHIIEHLVLYLAELAGHNIKDQQRKVEVSGVSGHIDSIIDGEVCDVKSASPFSFKKFQSGDIVGDDPFGYHAQLAAYEEGCNTKAGGFLVVPCCLIYAQIVCSVLCPLPFVWCLALPQIIADLDTALCLMLLDNTFESY